MQAAVYLGAEDIQVQDWPEPSLSAGEVLVQVHYAGICGTDMMIYRGKHPRATPPRVLGYEVFGSIADLGPGVEPAWRKGRRVAVYPLISCGQCTPCREGNAYVCEKLGLIGIDRDGGFATYVKADQQQLVLVPDEASDEQAAVIEPLAVTVHAVRNSSFRPGDSVLVTGGGPIGNLLTQVLRASGARSVIVSETRPLRRDLARRIGFATLNPDEEKPAAALLRLGGERHVDAVFEATGVSAAYKDAVECCKVRGELVFVGIPKAPPELDILSIVFKEISIRSARVYTLRDFQAAIALLARHAVDVLPLITDRLPLRETSAGFERMRKAETSLKILLVP